jgi:hypothetical protein
MDKIDFDILLTTIPSANDRQDVALVEGSYNIAQQIKNVVLLDRSENSFNYALGTNIKSFLMGNLSNVYIVVDQINTAITYAVKNVNKVRTRIYNNGGILTIVVKYDYSTKTSSSVNNQVTITMDTNT